MLDDANVQNVVAEEVTEVATQASLSGGQKVAMIAGVVLLTGCAAFGVYAIAKHIKRKRAAKKAETTDEQTEM